MCGINGILNIKKKNISNLTEKLKTMNKILKHRGPDGNDIWCNDFVGFGHTRLKIIDLSENASQPMIRNNYVITYNGEIYNYKELKENLDSWDFKSDSDTEVILACYEKYGEECLQYLNGMFSFSIWDINTNKLFCARDRVGIKPFYYFLEDDTLYFASEVKALLKNIYKVEEDIQGISEYLLFQYPITDSTMFKNIKQLMPGHTLICQNGEIKIDKYWDIDYSKKLIKTEQEHIDTLEKLIKKSMDIHMRSDVPVASYVSGGIDSSFIASIGSKYNESMNFFHGRFKDDNLCDESKYAQLLESDKHKLYIKDMSCDDFKNNIEKIIYFMDYPVAGPGSFPQFMVSELVSKHNKVILGGQGGDELFMGYVRYLVPYFEKCLEEAIYSDGEKLKNISENLSSFRRYEPMLSSFFKDNLFGDITERYFQIIDRSKSLGPLLNNKFINNKFINKENIFAIYKEKFNAETISSKDYLEKMTNFDIKYSLPGLLHVEDRVSMAWGLESRVPLLNHEIIEYLAKIPESIKFKDGKMKYMLKEIAKKYIPGEILNRKDKMGFPVPINNWFQNELKDYYLEKLIKLKNRNLNYLNISDDYIKNIQTENTFSRNNWILLNLELWYEIFF